MQLSFALLTTLAATALAQGVTQQITPTAAAPAGCQPTFPGKFEISVVNASTPASKRDVESVEKRQLSGILTLTLANGVLTDQAGRTGYIASNYQFQFDGPPQAGAIYTAGFSACGNNSLALGGSTIFYQCYSGGFYNLYDRYWAAQCSPIYLQILTGSTGPASQKSDGQPGGTTVLSVKSDGQAVPTLVPVSQLSDGQPQGVTTLMPVYQTSDGQIQKPTGNPISQISDGQPQATGKPGNATFTTPAPSVYTGAAATPIFQMGAVAAGLIGVAALL